MKADNLHPPAITKASKNRHQHALMLAAFKVYCNDGDWIDSSTALIEQPDGSLKFQQTAINPTLNCHTTALA